MDQRAGTYVADSKISVGEYGARWLASQLQHRDRSRDTLDNRWRLHIEPRLGEHRLQAVTRADVQDAVNAWADRLAPNSVLGIYQTLAAILGSAVEDDLIPRTPCRKINLPIVLKHRVVPLTVNQVHHIAETIHPSSRAMVLLAAASGLRLSELRGLTADRVSFHPDGTGTVRVDRQLATTTPTWGPPKTPRSDRSVRIDALAADVVRDHLVRFSPHPSGLIFTGVRGLPLSRSTYSDMWQKATTGLVLPESPSGRSGFHDLRHFHASLLIAAGLSVTAVADRLGHKNSRETLDTYAHLWPNDEDRALAALRDGFWEQTQSRSLHIVAGQSVI
ncbi:tyrosine-type recombinase/integrase [Nakamurella leprariae]|uniref:Site-specific integrase n=1 Tax=Nakamurella leprariae TaxID=2803911 RepID=A0A938Y734_9ACTN|nr:site-specific integrase [Nakamurella leprariae]MBM9467236.1 site-specific integrase [Nakamurella leprariae]